jgi:hypothetical protein
VSTHDFQKNKGKTAKKEGPQITQITRILEKKIRKDNRKGEEVKGEEGTPLPTLHSSLLTPHTKTQSVPGG